jgi:hypothetical protein
LKDIAEFDTVLAEISEARRAWIGEYDPCDLERCTIHLLWDHREASMANHSNAIALDLELPLYAECFAKGVGQIADEEEIISYRILEMHRLYEEQVHLQAHAKSRD